MTPQEMRLLWRATGGAALLALAGAGLVAGARWAITSRGDAILAALLMMSCAAWLGFALAQLKPLIRIDWRTGGSGSGNNAALRATGNTGGRELEKADETIPEWHQVSTPAGVSSEGRRPSFADPEGERSTQTVRAGNPPQRGEVTKHEAPRPGNASVPGDVPALRAVDVPGTRPSPLLRSPSGSTTRQLGSGDRCVRTDGRDTNPVSRPGRPDLEQVTAADQDRKAHV
jgi:hypothetical protein